MIWIAKGGQKMLVDAGTLPYWEGLGWEVDANADGIGDSAASNAVVRAFPFTFDTPGLVTGYDTGYAPAAGDVLLDAWFTVEEAFVTSGGLAAKADFGYYVGAGNSALMGLFRYGASGAFDVRVVDADANSWPEGFSAQQGGAVNSSDLRQSFDAAAGLVTRGLPAEFTQSHNIKIIVNVAGDLATGGDPGMSAGAATLYLATATPLVA